MPTLLEENPPLNNTADVTDTVVKIARQLAEESRSQRGVLSDISIDSDITKDLGFDSLARVELFTRLNKQFNVDLGEDIFAEAITLKDLLPAITRDKVKPSDVGKTIEKEHAREKTQPTAAHEIVPPESAQTLVDVINWYVERYPDRAEFQLYDDEKDGDIVSYGELLTQSQAVAAGLQSLGVGVQHPVAIMLPTGKDYFYSFFGILLAGCIPVPLYPPARPSQLEDHVRRHTGILNNCQASVLITVKQAKTIARLLKSQVESIKHIVTVDELQAGQQPLRSYNNKAEDIAFIQYTSGSTGNPKGVVLTHQNLLANIRAMGHAVKANSQDVFVSWLPLYHDMGLIGAWLGSLYYGARLVVMSPLAFLTKPQRWLWAIHRHGGTLAASPNFGYEFCVRRIASEDIENLDLSSWRCAFNGAEPVSPDTVRRFCDRFAEYGFRREAYMSVFGLAENSVGLAFPPLNRGPVIDRIQRKVFMESGQAIPAAADDDTAIEFVACGNVLINHQIRIVDNSNKEIFNRHEGRLQFRGPSATSGYYRAPKKNRELFCDGWLDTGDLAYLAKDDVYLTGRTKDIIIRGGRNIYPHELEDAVGNITGIRTGRVAVFGSKDTKSKTETLIVLAETRETDQKVLERLRAEVNTIVNDLVGLPPDDIVLAPPGSVLKTSSGKLRRSASKSLYEEGRVGKSQQPVWLQLTHLALSGVASQFKRFARTSLAVAYALYARSMFWVLAPLAWTLVAIIPSMRCRWFVMRSSTRALAFLIGVRLTNEGARNLLPPQQTCIYVANHGSYMDGPIVIAMVPRFFSFIAKAELARQFVPHLFLKRINSRFVERFDLQKSVADSQQLLDHLKTGQSLFFFPEGTFHREEGLLPFHMGAFVLAAEARVPVVTVTIDGSRRVFRADDWMPRRHPIHVTIGTPIDPAACDNKKDNWTIAVWLRDQARTQILEKLPEPDAGAHQSKSNVIS
jgi:1-acyl-sn-glycerol-3-phosphate acyltransferase